ncbi:MAG: M48 family metalloprotease [Thermococcus sp.]|uniref:M48 family metalloprotease n=1 Tax=Thermococcus sp. TaxID=35749 RepID=UPI001D31206E|nr:M48 family metalloprotease [Thermococcus sp.]MBO8173953.1 M48 family metalloprotease [Thermococcus sp.]
MKEILMILVSCVTIVVPPLIMRYWGRKILTEELPKKERNYKLMKTEVICIVGAFIFYLPLMIALGALDWTSNLVDALPLPDIIKVFAFVAIFIFPILLSIFLIIYETVKIGINITEEKIENPKKEVLKALALILGPIFGFAFIWLLLMIYLPESLTSKWWFDLILYAFLILMFFALFPLILVRIGSKGELDPEFKAELMKFCEEQGIRVRDIIVKGKPGQRLANAMVTGIIPGYRYIVLTRGLVENFEKDEIKAILAHEIGHIKGKHLWINAALSIGWFIFWIGIVCVLHKFGIKLFSSPWVFFGIYFFAFFLWLFGIESWIIQRNEFRADEFAAKVSGKDTVIRALRKLADLNLTPERTGKWFNILSFHPSIEERIRHLEEVKE